MKILSTFCSLAALTLLTGTPAAFADTPPANSQPVNSAQMAKRVKAEFLHAWKGYKRYAWGHDELRPLSKTAYDWYGTGHSLLMTPVDALDTLIIMGLDKQADAARKLIDTKLDLDQDIYVKVFEINIRLLGGLLSGYEMTGDKRLLELAEDLGNRLLPAFNSPTGLPYMYVNLKTGDVRGQTTNPAETGTLILEFGTLSKLTGNPIFHNKAKRALLATYDRRSRKTGLVGLGINIVTGQWTNPDASISGGNDSYYEYLYKCWRLFGDKDCLHMWNTSIKAINTYLADDVHGYLWYGHANMNTGKRTATHFGALDAFFPALLALAGDVDRAARLEASAFSMWQLHGIEPEQLDYTTLKVVSPGYVLRPEIIESAYYLYHYTHDPKYPGMVRAMFNDFVKYCRTQAGYASLDSVITKQKKDRMPSYVMAETFKYFYLAFKPDAVDFDAVTFNTEAHPLKPVWKAQAQGHTPESTE